MFLTSVPTERLAARKHNAIADEHTLIADTLEESADKNDGNPGGAIIVAVFASIVAWVVFALVVWQLWRLLG